MNDDIADEPRDTSASRPRSEPREEAGSLRAPTDSASASCGRDIFIILLLAAILFLPALPSRDPWNPDEPRYVEVAREMVERGDYLVPHLNGTPYPDKPPMFFWLAAALYRLGCGWNAGRVLAALASAGTLVITYWLARRYLTGLGPLFAALSMLTAFLFAATSKTGVIDPVLTFFTTATIGCGLSAMESDARRGRRWWLAAYALAGCGVLAKGPVGAFAPALVLTACGFALRRRVNRGGWIHAAGAALLLAIAAAWVGPAAIRGGEKYARELLSESPAYVVRSSSHHNPFYYYFALAPLLLLPWTFLIVPAFHSAARAWRGSRERGAAVGLAWFGAVFLFFTCMSAKRVGYIMPLMPAFGLLMGRYFEEARRNEHPWRRVHRVLERAMVCIMAVLLALIVIAAPATRRIIAALPLRDPTLKQEVLDAARGVQLPVICGAALALAWLLAAWRRRGGRAGAAFVAVVGALVAISLTIDFALLPRANRFKSGRFFIARAQEGMRRARKVYLYKKDFDGVYNLYAGVVSFPVLYKPKDLKEAVEREEQIAVIGRDTDIAEVLGMPPRVGRIVATSRVGHRNMVLLVNWPEDVRPAGPDRHAPSPREDAP